jgi:hypothetical protein
VKCTLLMVSFRPVFNSPCTVLPASFQDLHRAIRFGESGIDFPAIGSMSTAN